MFCAHLFLQIVFSKIQATTNYGFIKEMNFNNH